MRTRPYLTAALTLVALNAHGQEPFDVDVQNFRPAMDSRSFITVERSKALGTLEPSFGLYLDWAFNPLSQSIGGEDGELIESYGTGRFMFALGFGNVVEIGANIPVVIVRGDADGQGEAETFAGDGFGDAGLSMKVRILDRERFPVGIAIVPAVQFGSGESNVFASHAQDVIVSGDLVLDFELGSRVGFAVNAGARFREERSISDAVTVRDANGNVTATPTRDDPYVLGNEVTYSAGVGILLIPERLELIFEGYGASPLISGAARATPLEALAALRLFLLGNSFLTIGATRGLLDSYGDPDARVFGGIIFEPAVGDRDGDGVPDDIDNCPDDPEDRDGYEDADGCPDPDNDGDGILDIVDQCPDIAEDFNGFEDEDGCPDGKRDRDRDGILDVDDRCPDDPEDKDGFQDSDGCPDLDNDRDGIPDVSDECPNQAEDIDGFKDEDGCPDPDNDQDGIPDVKDECPNQPENFNGIDDEDGCPEVPKKVVISGGQIRILEKVYFDFDSDVIQRRSFDILFQVAEVLRQNPQILRVEVQGHSDSRGGDRYNMRLSDRRANAVRTFLTARGGIQGGRLEANGYGETKPIDPAENVQAWEKNRRVEFIILEEAPEKPFDSPVIP